MFRRLKKWLVDRAQASQFETQVHVADVDGAITVTSPDGSVESVAWSRLRHVEIHTNDSGPWGADVWWVFEGDDGRCSYPQGSTGDADMLERLQALPGFDNEQVILAMGWTDNRVFRCWSAPEPPAPS